MYSHNVRSSVGACYGWSPLGLVSRRGTSTTPSSMTGGPSASRACFGVGIAMRTATLTAGGADVDGDEDTGVEGTIGDVISAGENGVRKGRRKRIVRDDASVWIWGDSGLGDRGVGADLI